MLRKILLAQGMAGLLLLVPELGDATPPCGQWNLVVTPDVSGSRLTAVTASSAADAWTVGYVQPPGQRSLVLHWDGSAWTEEALPDLNHLGTFPETAGVDAAGQDVWIVGRVSTTYPTYSLPLVLRWRNGDWDYHGTVTLRPQTVYPYAARGGSFAEVDALTPNDIWAVGLAAGFGDGAATSVPLAAHWDGSDWTEIDVPRVANRHHELNDVVVISHDDVWAVGDYRNVAGIFRGITYHWNGQMWSHVDSPIEHMGTSGLEDIAASASDDVWAIGGSDGAVVLMHWDGTLWTTAEPPPNSGGSLIALGPNDLWVSGWSGFFHWDGSGWTEVPASVPGATYVLRGGGLARVGECDIWSAGFWTLSDGTTSRTLMERLQPETTTVAEAAQGEHALFINFRNPFLPGHSIRFQAPENQAARLVAYDLQGRMVRSLFDSQSSGTEALTWDGRKDGGGRLPSGVYFLTLEVPGKQVSRKLLLLGGDQR